MVVRAVVSTRLAVLLVGWLAVVTFGVNGSRATFEVSRNKLVNLPARWDAGWYVAIAANGYQWDGNGTRQQTVAFFPAFPWIMSIVPRGQVLRLWFGTAVSMVLFGVALLLLLQLARLDMFDDEARAAVWLTATYPFALFFGIPYTESLFLAASVGAFYYLRTGHHRVAFAWAMIAGLSRPNGCLLVIPLALVALDARSFTPRLTSLRAWGPDILVMAAPAVGMLVFSAYLYFHVGDGLAWMHAQQAWGRSYGEAMANFVELVTYLRHRGITGFVADAPFEALNGVAGMAALAAVIPVARRFGLPYATFIVVNLVPAILSGGTMSLGRMTSVLFPVFLYLASVTAGTSWYGWAAAFAMGQGFMAALFFTWRGLV